MTAFPVFFHMCAWVSVCALASIERNAVMPSLSEGGEAGWMPSLAVIAVTGGAR